MPAGIDRCRPFWETAILCITARWGPGDPRPGKLPRTGPGVSAPLACDELLASGPVQFPACARSGTSAGRARVLGFRAVFFVIVRVGLVRIRASLPVRRSPSGPRPCLHLQRRRFVAGQNRWWSYSYYTFAFVPCLSRRALDRHKLSGGPDAQFMDVKVRFLRTVSARPGILAGGAGGHHWRLSAHS